MEDKTNETAEADAVVPTETGEAEKTVEATPETSEPQAKADASTIDPDLAKRAAEYGMSEEDIALYGEHAGEMIARFASLYEGQVASLGRGQAKAPEPEVKPDVKEEAKPVVRDDIAKILKDGGYDEEDPIFKVISAMEKRNADLESQLANRGQTEVADKAMQETEAFFKSVPEEFRDLLGTGDTFSLDQSSKEFDFRMKLVDEMAALQAGYRMRGKDLPVADLGKKALAILAADRVREIERRKLEGKVKARAAKVTTAPGGSTKREANVAQSIGEAEAAIAGLMKEKGLSLV